MPNQIMTIAEANKLVSDADTELKEFKQFLFEKREEEFYAAGGCKVCLGHGTVCTWGTLDSLSGGYDEFGPCDACDGAVMPWVGANRHRKRAHPKLHNLPPLAVTEDEQEELESLKDNLKIANDILQTTEAQWKIIKGSKVRVVKGRKTPKGTVGTVFWMGEQTSTYGWQSVTKTRVGIKDENDKVYWVNDINYLELLNPRTEEDLDNARKAQKMARNIRAAVSKGSQVVSDKVSGKVEWAGYTKRGSGPWRALVKADGKDHWLSATEIRSVA